METIAPRAINADRIGIGLVALVVLVTLFVYSPVRQHGFVVLDDRDYVVDNRVVQAGLTWAGVRWAFTTTHASNWHPATWLTHMIDVELFGPGPAGPHVVNVLLHLANTILLFAVLRLMTSAPRPSAFVAALFALHPLRVESVAWIAERKDVLSGLFFLLTLWAYAKYACSCRGYEAESVLSPRRLHVSAWYLAALVLFALGLMSKPMLVTLPCVLLLLDIWPLRRTPAHAFIPSRALVLEKLPFFALSAASCVVTVIAQRQGGAVQSLETFTLTQRIANALVSYARYLEKTFWPAELAVFYPHSGAWPVTALASAALLLIAVSVVALWWARKLPFAAVGWLWFCGMLVPTIGLVQVGGQSMADRYTYLPSIGLLIAFVWVTRELVRRRRLSRVVVGCAAAAAAVLLAGCALVTRRQLEHWRNDESLFRRTLAVTEKNFVAHHSLGFAYFHSGRTPEAIAELTRSLELRPDFADAHNMLGTVLLSTGSVDQGLAHFREAVSLRPGFGLARYNLGTALQQTGRATEAVVELKSAADARPHDCVTQLNLGNAHLALGQFEAAMNAYAQALAIDPQQPDAWSNFGTALLRQGRVDEAIRHFERAVALDPRHVNAHFNLGDVFLRHQRFDAAIPHLRTCLELQPDDAEVRDSLGTALMQTGRSDEAAQHLRRAAELRQASASLQPSPP
jgi:protein O-mannosyl-transferase